MLKSLQQANEETHRAWEANAVFWDEKMGEGNDFANLLCWPAIYDLLEVKPGHRILDIGCGNGIFSRRLAELGAEIDGFDFSKEMVKLARKRTHSSLGITYRVIDATDESELLSMARGAYTSSLCNMALFDMADVEPLFRVLPQLLKPGGSFVFTIMHPAFNNSSAVHVVEELDAEGKIETVYSIKVSRYMTTSQARGLAIRGQPKPQIYFDRPIQYYFNLGFNAGFVLDGFQERAFAPGHPQGSPLGWGGEFSEIPPVLAARMRLNG